MKTSILLLPFFLFLSSFSSLAQSEDFSCDFSPSEERYNSLKNENNEQNRMYRQLNDLEKEQLSKVRKIVPGKNGDFQVNYAPTVNLGRKYIPIVAHVLRRDNGTGGLKEQELIDALDIVNSAYLPVNFIFQLCQIKYIDSTALYGQTFSRTWAPGASHTDILDIANRNVSRKINIYFVPNANASSTTGPNTDPLKQHILMINAHAITGTILAHELGHWFGLYHTHQGANDPINGELVDGSNCFIAGDLTCDTPADPNMQNRVDANCQFVSTLLDVDANGDFYNPDPSNVMSYASSECIYRFSNGQHVRLLISYLNMQQERGYTLLPCSPLSASN